MRALAGLSTSGTLGELLLSRAEVSPGVELGYRRASAGPDDVRLSLYQLARQAGRIAEQVCDRAAAGERVLLLYSPGLDFVAALLACSLAGVVAVPVASPSPSPAQAAWYEHLACVCRESGPRFGLCNQELLSRLRPVDLDLACGPVPLVPTDTDGSVSSAGESRLPRRPDEHEVALLLYSSGSTGRPRPVAVRHGQLLATVAAIRDRFGLTSADRFVSWLPMSHDMGLVGGVLAPLLAGCPAWYLSPEDFVRRPSLWLEEISRVGGTFSGGPDLGYRLCSERVTDEQVAQLDLSAWQVAFSGGERVRPATLEAFGDRFAACGFRPSAFLPCYGLAEATFVSSRARGSGARRHHRGDVELVGVGHPAPGLEVVVVDPETRAPTPSGFEGEVWVRGPSVAAGYWADPPATRHVFDAHFVEGEGVEGEGIEGGGPFLRTGDLGRVVDGELVICGRLEDELDESFRWPASPLDLS